MKKPRVYRHIDQKTFIDSSDWTFLCLFPRPKAYYRALVEAGSFHVLRCSNTKEQHNGKDHTAQSIAPFCWQWFFHQCSFVSRWWATKKAFLGEFSSLPFWGIIFPQFDGGASVDPEESRRLEPRWVREGIGDFTSRWIFPSHPCHASWTLGRIGCSQK